MNAINIKWFLMNDKAKLPTKTDENAGFDIYTTEDYVKLEPHTQHLFATGICAAVDKGYWLMAFDRGSTGSKGMHVHCGVVDNGYRGEIFICIKNDNDYPIIVTRSVDKPYFEDLPKIFYYPANKAIAQLIPVAQPVVKSSQCNAEEWELLCNTERGKGKLGSSGK